MRIAITDLKDYNEGILRYEWLDLETCSTADEISEYITNLLEKRSKETGELHEEWFVTDYEDFVDLGEYPSFDKVEKAVKLSKEYTPEIVSKYYSNFQEFEHLEEAYNGIHESEEDFAYNLVKDCYSEKELGVLKDYIDYEKFARDLFMTDYTSEKLENYKIVVFRRF